MELEHPPSTTRTIGQLAIGGDWACAHGDIGTLGCLARQLSEYMTEPLHCELVALAEQCCADPAGATARWPSLRDLVFQSSRQAH